ncbi:MAG: SocA family protein [Flavisolibacter sp.]|nr:SocA family protein [Flavisolibacter sp.]
MIKPEVYTKNQIEKLGNTLIFLAERLEKPSKTHLLKLIFIIEEISIKKFGIPFFNLRFDVWKLGPVSKDLYVELTGELNLLEPYIIREDGNDSTLVRSKKDFSDDEFNDNELHLLSEITERFKYCTANERINFTHKKDTPWYNTALKHGVLEVLESGKLNVTNIEINLAEVIAEDEIKTALYNSHKDFLAQSSSLKS